MDRRQEAKLRMYNVLISFCNKNVSITDTLPAFKIAFNSFVGSVTLLTDTARKQAGVLTGIRKDKVKMRKALAKQAATIASKIFAYATSIGNNELKEKVNFSTSDLLRFPDEEFTAVCFNILEAAKENFTPLEPYNITDIADGSFEANIKAYIAMSPTTRNALSERSSQGTSIAASFKTTDDILKNQMDKVAREFIEVNIDFYYAYRSNRIIVDPPTRSTQIKGNIANSVTGKPMQGVTITVAGSKLTATTNSKGNFVIKPVPHGLREVNIFKEGFQRVIISDLDVEFGKTVKLKVGLVQGPLSP